MHHLWCCAETNRVSRGPNMEGCWCQLHSPSDTWPVFFWIWSCNLFLGHHFLLWFPSEHVDKYRFMKTFCDLIPFKFTYPSYHRYYLIHFNIIIYCKKRYILDSLACRYLGQYIIDSSSRDTSSYLYPFMYEHVISNLKSYSRFLFFVYHHMSAFGCGIGRIPYLSDVVLSYESLSYPIYTIILYTSFLVHTVSPVIIPESITMISYL